MAITMYQRTVGTATAVLVGLVPSGAQVILSSTQTSADVYLGLGTATTSANGCPMDTGGPTIITNPPGEDPFSVYAVAGTGSHVVGVVLVTGVK